MSDSSAAHGWGHTQGENAVAALLNGDPSPQPVNATQQLAELARNGAVGNYTPIDWTSEAATSILDDPAFWHPLHRALPHTGTGGIATGTAEHWLNSQYGPDAVNALRRLAHQRCRDAGTAYTGPEAAALEREPSAPPPANRQAGPRNRLRNGTIVAASILAFGTVTAILVPREEVVEIPRVGINENQGRTQGSSQGRGSNSGTDNGGSTANDNTGNNVGGNAPGGSGNGSVGENQGRDTSWNQGGNTDGTTREVHSRHVLVRMYANVRNVLNFGANRGGGSQQTANTPGDRNIGGNAPGGSTNGSVGENQGRSESTSSTANTGTGNNIGDNADHAGNTGNTGNTGNGSVGSGRGSGTGRENTVAVPPPGGSPYRHGDPDSDDTGDGGSGSGSGGGTGEGGSGTGTGTGPAARGTTPSGKAQGDRNPALVCGPGVGSSLGRGAGAMVEDVYPMLTAGDAGVWKPLYNAIRRGANFDYQVYASLDRSPVQAAKLKCAELTEPEGVTDGAFAPGTEWNFWRTNNPKPAIWENDGNPYYLALSMDRILMSSQWLDGSAPPETVEIAGLMPHLNLVRFTDPAGPVRRVHRRARTGCSYHDVASAQACPPCDSDQDDECEMIIWYEYTCTGHGCPEVPISAGAEMSLSAEARTWIETELARNWPGAAVRHGTGCIEINQWDDGAETGASRGDGVWVGGPGDPGIWDGNLWIQYPGPKPTYWVHSGTLTANLRDPRPVSD